ncbi:hypothetical protein DSM107003_29130 [Trichormus variabilis SAG 1403-4b]|uniref:Uncharacterized protein n=1 Tax=Trichormus variabilis SAG 1403-4b TaxID=447716 RepID=A0A3S1IDE4_ANAVA|nr:hypothetical protein DSM107003_29130 [Trichormus variabilis SAG 1403-4b]
MSVAEVWFFQNNQFAVYNLRDESYQLVSKCELLPNLDLTILAQYVVADDPLDATIAFREKIREMAD